VFSTPNLIGLIEHTVGMEIELGSLSPTPLGAKVTITTRVIHTEGRENSSQVEAWDEQELIARGSQFRATRVRGRSDWKSSCR
jgi:predicted thioesterase